MPPVLTSNEVVRALEQLGFVEVAQKNADVRTAVVTMRREVAPGTLRSIVTQAGATIDDIAARAK